MRYNVHDALRNIIAYYTKKFKNSIFGCDLKLLSFSKINK